MSCLYMPLDSNPKDLELPEWQKTLIESMYNLIKNNYVFHANVTHREFNKMLYECLATLNSEFPTADKEKFCTEINSVLKLIDPHLILKYDPNQIADHFEHGRIIDDPRKNGCAKFKLDGIEPPQAWFDKFAKENYGFAVTPPDKSLSVPTNIGYVKINDFLDPRDKLGYLAQQKAFEILNNMRDKKAIIIDLRDSHGGSPEMVEFIISYLLSEADKAQIKDGVYNRIYDLATGQSKEYHVKPTKFNLNVPVRIIINDQTFSAAEELVYDLQQINKHALKNDRFLVIGQTTQGGAHSMTGFPLMETAQTGINKDYFLWVPTKTTINPYTKTNWEDGPKKEGQKPGVRADVEIPKEENALKFAVDQLKTLIALETSAAVVNSQSMFSKIDGADKKMTEHSFRPRSKL